MTNLVTRMSALLVASVLLIAANNRAVVSAAPGTKAVGAPASNMHSHPRRCAYGNNPICWADSDRACS